MTTAADSLLAFLDAMRQHGLEPAGKIQPDGKLHRIGWKGDKAGDRAGYYVLYLDGSRPAGAFGCWRRGIKQTWCAGAAPLTAEERHRLRERVRAEQARRERTEAQRKVQAAETAAQAWQRCGPAPADHPYLVLKRVQPHSCRVDAEGRLVLPIAGLDGRIASLQTIAADGTKRFLAGGAKAGHFVLLGQSGPVLLVAEGFATAASLHEATGYPVAVAFDAGNLLPVCRVLAEAYPSARLLVAADDDFRTDGNPGLAKARAAAKAVGAKVVEPVFSDPTRRGTDFNDLALAEGPEAVRGLVQEALAPRIRQGRYMLVGYGDELLAPGVYREVEEKNGDGQTSRRWAWRCSWLEVAADTRDAGSESWGRLLRVVDPDGVVHEWAMPMALLAGDGVAMREHLLGLGLRLAPGSHARSDLQEYVTLWRPKAKARCVDRVGWHDAIFVLPDRAYGDTGGEDVLLQVAGAPPVYTTGGDLAAWQETVGQLAAGNSRLVLVIAAALAGATLHLMDEESGGIHLAGFSSSGKTTALHVAGSVWGVRVQSWRATDNAGELMARGACDTLLCLDELGQADARTLDGFAYMLANGSGKARMRRDATARPPALWRLLFLSTGELGMAQRLAEAGRKSRAGQSVRVVEIPADAGAGMRLFEELHGRANADALARELRRAAAEHTGAVGRAFVEHLVADPAAARADLDGRRRRWLADQALAGADGQVLRVAGRFALLAAAGELAIERGILPWERDEVATAARVCFRAWIEGRGGTGAADLRDGLAQVRAFLELHGSSRFEAPWHRGRDPEPQRPDDPAVEPAELKTVNRAGFRKAESGKWAYFILPEVWRSEVCAGADAIAIAREMGRRGWLGAADGKHLAAKVRVPGLGIIRAFHVLPDFLADEDVG